MPLTKVLHKIQSQITDLAPTLELFLDTTLQPTPQDCEQLQKQLVTLQEDLAVYKFSLSDIDFSPSFKIHAKISEKEIPPPVAAPAPPPPVQEPAQPEARQPETPAPSKVKPLVVGINDKFRFINELFSQNNSEYHIAFQQLNNLNNWNDSEIYLNSLKNLYGWPEKNEAVKYFYSVVKKRFE